MVVVEGMLGLVLPTSSLQKDDFCRDRHDDWFQQSRHDCIVLIMAQLFRGYYPVSSYGVYLLALYM